MKTVQELFSTTDLFILALLVMHEADRELESSNQLFAIWEKIDNELKRRGEAGDPDSVQKGLQKIIDANERKIATLAIEGFIA